MTDRVQPGAIDSIVRNDELAAVLGQFSEGGIIPGSSPSKPSRRRPNIDETALDAFSLTTSASSFDISVAPGEAYIEGWCCRDVSTALTVPANATTEIVVGWDSNASFDPAVDPTRDSADQTIVDLAGNVATDVPRTVVHTVTADGSGVTDTERVANVGGFTDVSTDSINGFGVDSVTSNSDLPAVNPPQIIFVEDADSYRRAVPSAQFSLRNRVTQQTISSQDNNPNGIAFNRNGTKLFEIGNGSKLIYESDLSTPFDISTATFQQSVSTQSGSAVRGFEFSPDGTKLYEVDIDDIFQSNLSSAFDISTATFQQSISPQSDISRAVALSNDGTKLFELGLDTSSAINQTEIFESSLSDPFDISTAINTTRILGQDNDATGLTFSDDGTRLFEISESTIYESVLSSPFDLSTARFLRSFTPTAGGGQEDIAFGADGSKVFVIDRLSEDIIERTCTGPDFVSL